MEAQSFDIIRTAFIQAFPRIFSHIQGYWCIFSHNHRRATRRNTGGHRKKCLDFGKKDIDCVNHWVKFSIQNLVLRVSWRKNFKIFLCGAFRTGGLFKTLWNVDQAYWRPCHRTLSSNFQAYSESYGTLA